MSRWLNDLRGWALLWRRRLKVAFPLVQRRNYDRLLSLHDAVVVALTQSSPPASSAQVQVIKPFNSVPTDELCLFVTHAPEPHIKPHVLWHIAAMQQAGIGVVLIINTDWRAEQFQWPPGLADSLSALWVRQNMGFDFAAWAHFYRQFPGLANTKRLLLVNDSMVGPLDATRYDELLKRLRSSPADVLGLTEQAVPRWHLQSYFLALGPRALAHPGVNSYLNSVQCLPTKETVIDVYETRLSKYLLDQGLTLEALFPAAHQDVRSGTQWVWAWSELLDRGMPFVKVSTLKIKRQQAALRKRVPSEIWPG